MIYVLDTHAIVWHLANDRRLGQAARRILDGTSRLIVPTIVIAELKHLAAGIRVPLSFDNIIAALMADPRCQIYPLDIFTVVHLPANLDIHDAIIVATGLFYREVFAEEVSILTADNRIRASGLLPVVW
jgi:predicted nucleic acid-binding protein